MEKIKEVREVYKKIAILGVGNIGFSLFSAFRSFYLIFFLNKFTTSKTHIGILMSIISFVGIVIPPIIGIISDKMRKILRGRKYLIIFSLLLFILALLRLEHTKDVYNLYINLLLVSIFFYSAFAPFQSLVPDLIPKNFFATATGITNFTSYFAQGLYVILVLLSHSEFLRFLIIYIGVILSALSLLLLTEDPQNFKKPDIDFNYFKGKTWIKLFSLQWLIWYGISSVSSFLLLFFRDALSASLKDYILALGFFGIISWLSTIPIGYIADKHSKGKITAIGLGLFAISSFLFSQSSRLIHIYPTLIIYGISSSILMIVPYSLLLSYIPKEKAGSFVGINNLVISTAQVVSYFLSGLIIDYGSYQVNFLQGTIASALALLILKRINNSS
ncbi:MAG: MFS transporter [Dictyoglomus sp. NZ13-RE01]|nr:MAG: MFS transporter [Dictyoglomus sp. NZ13-RE01]